MWGLDVDELMFLKPEGTDFHLVNKTMAAVVVRKRGHEFVKLKRCICNQRYGTMTAKALKYCGVDAHGVNNFGVQKQTALRSLLFVVSFL